jgi:hypothetical protein
VLGAKLQIIHAWFFDSLRANGTEMNVPAHKATQDEPLTGWPKVTNALLVKPEVFVDEFDIVSLK